MHLNKVSVVVLDFKMNVFLAEFGREESQTRTLLGVFSSLQAAMAAWNERPDHSDWTLYVVQVEIDKVQI